MDIFKKTPLVSEIGRPTFRKVDTTSNLEARVDVLEANSAPVAAYTEISFTWYQTGISDPVIKSVNSSPGTTIAATFEDTGLFIFEFPAIFIDKDKVEILGSGFLAPGPADDPKAISYAMENGNETKIIANVYDPTSSFVAINGVGSDASGIYATLIIRIFPA